MTNKIKTDAEVDVLENSIKRLREENDDRRFSEIALETIRQYPFVMDAVMWHAEIEMQTNIRKVRQLAKQNEPELNDPYKL